MVTVPHGALLYWGGLAPPQNPSFASWCTHIGARNRCVSIVAPAYRRSKPLCINSDARLSALQTPMPKGIRRTDPNLHIFVFFSFKGIVKIIEPIEISEKMGIRTHTITPNRFLKFNFIFRKPQTLQATDRKNLRIPKIPK